MTIAEVNLLLGEFQLLLGHIVRHPKPETSGSQGPTCHGGVPPGVQINLLTTPPEEIAGNAALLQNLYSSLAVLTELAAPATVSSIYLTSAFLRDRMMSNVPAEVQAMARRLRHWAVATVTVVSFCFLIAIMLLLHVDRSRRDIVQLKRVSGEYQLVNTAIDQVHDPNLRADCLKSLPLSEVGDGRPDTGTWSLCDRLLTAQRQLEILRTELRRSNIASDRLSFLLPRRWLVPGEILPVGLSKAQWEASELRASAFTADLTGFVLPMLLGLLGAFTYVYRDIDRRVRTSTLQPGDGAHGTLRMLLGTILGGLLGVIWTNSQPIEFEGVALSLAALAFFVGYSVEVVFQIMEILVIKVVGQLQK